MCTNCLTEITKLDVCSTNVPLLKYSNILLDQHTVSIGSYTEIRKPLFYHHLFD